MTTTSRGVVAARVTEIRAHPNADFIRIALVDINIGRPLHIIFGGPPIIMAGCLVPAAPPGSTVGPQKIKMRRRNYRQMPSEGMLCSLAELGWDIGGPDQVAILKEVTPGENIDRFADGSWREHVDPEYFEAKRSTPRVPVLTLFTPGPFPTEEQGTRNLSAISPERGAGLVRNV